MDTVSSISLGTLTNRTVTYKGGASRRKHIQLYQRRLRSSSRQCTRTQFIPVIHQRHAYWTEVYTFC